MKTDIRRGVVWAVSLSLFSLASCGSVQSTVSSMSTIIPGVEPKKEERIKAGEKLNLKVPPQVALMLFQDVATENGWEVSARGDQRNINGEVTGKFFRVETIQFVGGRRIMSGVFFKEKDDDEASYVIMGKPGPEAAYGIPTALARSMLAAVAEWTGEVDETFETVEAETELSPLEEALGGDFEEESEAELEEQDEFEETEFSALEEVLGPDSVEDDALEDIELSPEEEEILEEIELGPIE
ncbi:MAG: hypothetical protein OXC18_22895 [Desulfurellaceae bacterium]|nr:hypothetical protein [Desulfurellaceae bacterium]